MRRGDRPLGDHERVVELALLHEAQHVAHDPVARRLGVGVRGDDGFEVVGEVASRGEDLGVVLREVQRCDEARAACVRQLGHAPSDFRDELV